MSFGYITIGHTRHGNAIRVKAHGELIRALGWDALDDGRGSYGQPPRRGPYTSSAYCPRIVAHKGGRPMRISFHPSTTSTHPGMAFRFRISGTATNANVLDLAMAAQGDWHWMTSLEGRRVSRAEWIAYAQGGLLLGKP